MIDSQRQNEDPPYSTSYSGFLSNIDSDAADWAWPILPPPLRTHGHEVEILDCQTEKKRSIPIPSELSYLKDFYPFDDRSPFKLYSGYYHFGMGWEEIRKKIEDSKADVFGISSSFTPYHGEALEIARIIKEWDRRKIVVMGGAHVSCDPEGVLKSPFVDYVILG